MDRAGHFRVFRALALIAMVLWAGVAPVSAGFATILDTDAPAVASYLSSTIEMVIPGSTGTGVSSLSGSDLTITFGSTLEAFGTPDWGHWAASPGPDVLWTTLFSKSVTLDFSTSSRVTTFGFEAEPGPWELHDVTAEFFDGATSLGAILLSVDGEGGSRLFAATLDDFGNDPGNVDKFTRVVVSSDADFALGGIRYTATSSQIPEPGTATMLLGGLAIGLPVLIARRSRVRHLR